LLDSDLDADPELACHSDAEADPDSGSQNYADSVNNPLFVFLVLVMFQQEVFPLFSKELAFPLR
jgi:hypothetical protein